MERAKKTEEFVLFIIAAFMEVGNSIRKIKLIQYSNTSFRKTVIW